MAQRLFLSTDIHTTNIDRHNTGVTMPIGDLGSEMKDGEPEITPLDRAARGHALPARNVVGWDKLIRGNEFAVSRSIGRVKVDLVCGVVGRITQETGHSTETRERSRAAGSPEAELE